MIALCVLGILIVFILFVLFSVLGFELGLVLARPVPYQLSYASSPFFFSLFSK
jgi:hypothetical protein